MMKRLLPHLLTLLLCAYPCSASLSDADEAADGYLIAGEYDSGTVKLEGTDKLIVNGGGASWIEAWNSSRLEIYSTSLPLVNHASGVYDIYLSDNSTLLFSGGAVESLRVGKNAQALLKGGTLNFLTIGRYGNMTSSVTIDCKDDWEWLYTAGKISGITGTWHSGTDFTIAFVNPLSPLLETWKSVHIIPEPATLLLLGLGGLMIRRKTL